MTTKTSRTIAVIGSTGTQGGAVVRALQGQGRFTVRALTRNPEKAAGLADEVVAVDLTQPRPWRLPSTAHTECSPTPTPGPDPM